MEVSIYKIYQKFGNYFTGSHRRKLFLTMVAILFIIIVLYSYYFEIGVSENTLNLVFSSITQALLSLVALLGVAAFFKLEGLRNEENQIIQSALHSNVYSWLSERLQGKVIVTGEDLMCEFEIIFKEGNPNESRIKILNRKLENLFLDKKLTQENVLTFTVYTLFVVVVSLCFLMISPFLVTHNLGIPALFLTMFLTTYCLFLVVKGIADAIYH